MLGERGIMIITADIPSNAACTLLFNVWVLLAAETELGPALVDGGFVRLIWWWRATPQQGEGQVQAGLRRGLACVSSSSRPRQAGCSTAQVMLLPWPVAAEEMGHPLPSGQQRRRGRDETWPRLVQVGPTMGRGVGGDGRMGQDGPACRDCRMGRVSAASSAAAGQQQRAVGALLQCGEAGDTRCWGGVR